MQRAEIHELLERLELLLKQQAELLHALRWAYAQDALTKQESQLKSTPGY